MKDANRDLVEKLAKYKSVVKAAAKDAKAQNDLDGGDALVEVGKVVQEMANQMNLLFQLRDVSIANKKEWIDEIRGLRTVVISECQQITRPLEDLRKFFLGENHDKEVARLKEFVEVCERMKALKESGFLDTVADTILKVS